MGALLCSGCSEQKFEDSFSAYIMANSSAGGCRAFLAASGRTLKPVYASIDYNVLLRAAEQESQSLTLKVRLLPLYHVSAQLVLFLLLIAKSEVSAGLL